MSELYRRTQIGTLTIVTFIIAFLTFLFLNLPDATTRYTILILLVVVAILFSSLTIVITETHLIFYFGPGIMKKKIPLKEITHCKPEKNSIFHGWGIKKIPGGWLFNVSGLKVVEVTLKNGKRYRIGSPEPEEVCRVVNDLKFSE